MFIPSPFRYHNSWRKITCFCFLILAFLTHGKSKLYILSQIHIKDRDPHQEEGRSPWVPPPSQHKGHASSWRGSQALNNKGVRTQLKVASEEKEDHARCLCPHSGGTMALVIYKGEFAQSYFLSLEKLDHHTGWVLLTWHEPTYILERRRF